MGFLVDLSTLKIPFDVLALIWVGDDHLRMGFFLEGYQLAVNKLLNLIFEALAVLYGVT
ncbi:hypothetical protein A2U01_0113409, partial [Trifolium medium]|nr:hypothetical protein [Trifolium medium]